MGIELKKGKDHTLLTVTDGSFKGEGPAELKRMAVEAIELGERKIFIDMKKPEYIDSSGVGKLLFLSKKLDKLNGELAVVKINKTLYSFLESLAITRVINISKP